MLGRFAVASCLALASAGGAVVANAQQAAPPQVFQSPVLTLNQQRLFEDSEFGKDSLLRLEADSRSLQAEIRKIESDLEIEERMLTQRRSTLSPAEFMPIAAAFDEKVEKIRNAWGAKDRDLKRQREADQQKFFETVVPILAELMQEMGAVMLVNQGSVILSLDRVDITQPAIERINERLATPPPAQTDPAQTDPAQTEPAQTEPAQPAPTAPKP